MRLTHTAARSSFTEGPIILLVACATLTCSLAKRRQRLDAT
jgi:hypothetical protein